MANDQDERMRKKGYIPAKEAAKLAGKSINTIYNWLEQDLVDGVSVGRSRFVKYTSFVEYIGEDACGLLGISLTLGR